MAATDEQTLIDQLENPSTDRGARIKALRALRKSGTERSVLVLTKSLASRDTRIRLETVITVGWVGTEPALRVVADSLTSLGDEVSIATVVLGNHKYIDAAPTVADLLEHRKLSSNAKGPILRALGLMQYEPAIPLMQSALKKRGTRRAAVKALLDVGSAESISTLRDALDEMPRRRRRWLQRVLDTHFAST